MSSIALLQAIALIDSGALVIDVRERSVSAGSHLPGAARQRCRP